VLPPANLRPDCSPAGVLAPVLPPATLRPDCSPAGVPAPVPPPPLPCVPTVHRPAAPRRRPSRCAAPIPTAPAQMRVLLTSG